MSENLHSSFSLMLFEWNACDIGRPVSLSTDLSPSVNSWYLFTCQLSACRWLKLVWLENLPLFTSTLMSWSKRPLLIIFVVDDASRPLLLLSVMMFITPAMASLPYSALAAPESISMRFMLSMLIRFHLSSPDTRLPFSNIRM